MVIEQKHPDVPALQTECKQWHPNWQIPCQLSKLQTVTLDCLTVRTEAVFSGPNIMLDIKGQLTQPQTCDPYLM